MSVKIIYFVHGTTTDNLEHKSTGWLPGKLSEKGIAQSINLRNQIDFDAIDLIISSDLKRAIDSANYTFGTAKPILHDPRIRECNYGDLNGRETSLIKYESHIAIPFPNGESLQDVEGRIKDFCTYLLEKHNHKTIALVSHKAPQLALDVITRHLTWESAIANDWRKTKTWQPGWLYELHKISEHSPS